MCPTRKAAVCRILLIIVALAPIALLIVLMVPRRDVPGKSREMNLQMPNRRISDASAVKNQAIAGRSPMSENRNQVLA